MEYQWRMCCWEGCKEVIGCDRWQKVNGVTVSERRDCRTCVNDGTCPPADAPISHGVCEPHAKAWMERIEINRLAVLYCFECELPDAFKCDDCRLLATG